MRPKILHVTQSMGGVETSLVLLFRHLDRARFEYHLACPPGTGLARRAEDLGVRVIGVQMVRSVHPVRDVAGLVALTRLMRRERYAVVHGHSAKGGYLARVAARLSGTAKAVYAPRGFSYLSQKGLASRVFLGLERLAVRWTHVLVAASESERRRAIEEVGFPAGRVVTIPNSVDFSEGGGLDARPSTPPVVLTVGRMSYQKNPEMFVRVAALVARRHPGVRFVWLGGGFAGPLEGEFRRLVAQAGLDGRVEILPWAGKRETLEAIARCTVFVLTSRFEGMPNTVLEALLVGKPVVVTDVDGSRDVVGDGVGGYTVPLNDDEAMAGQVARLLSDAGLASRVGEAGHGRAREMFDIRRNVRLLEAVYEKVMAA